MNFFDNATIRTTPPFRADHVGSFLRPEAIKKARQQAQHGLITKEALRSVEDDAIRALVINRKNVVYLPSRTVNCGVAGGIMTFLPVWTA